MVGFTFLAFFKWQNLSVLITYDFYAIVVEKTLGRCFPRIQLVRVNQSKTKVVKSSIKSIAKVACDKGPQHRSNRKAVSHVIPPTQEASQFRNANLTSKQGQRQRRRHCTSGGEQQTYRCKYCARMFANNFNLSLHVKVHLGTSPFACAFCQKQFSVMASLEFHLRAHTQEKPFGCKYCGRCFSAVTNLKEHVLQIHTGERPFKCPKCSKCFVTRRKFAGQVGTHAKVKPYKCRHCDARYGYSETRLKQERKVHGPPINIEPAMCTICDKKYSRKEGYS